MMSRYANWEAAEEIYREEHAIPAKNKEEHYV
jgi:hypothetical protein